MSTLAEALAPRSDQLNSDDLIPGPRVLKITNAKIVNDARQLKVVLNYEGDNGKPWKPCKSMGRAMVMAWGITDESQFVGRSVMVYRDPEVSFGDQKQIGGIRISHMSHLEKDASVKLTVSQGKKAIFTFKPLAGPSEPAPLTLEDARADLEVASDLAALERAWKRKAMAPFRDELAETLAFRKSQLTPAVDAGADEGFVA